MCTCGMCVCGHTPYDVPGHAPPPPQLKDEAVALVDVLAPPDHVLRAPIGLSNGEVLGEEGYNGTMGY